MQHMLPGIDFAAMGCPTRSLKHLRQQVEAEKEHSEEGIRWCQEAKTPYATLQSVASYTAVSCQKHSQQDGDASTPGS